ncbi:hypothetical protein [Deinococcus misasensis]|uniref:hypothetical protein n=1 Tax=Deinococcus misasensis TaxID=392413 RepID=UPI000B11567F|nr:hypothetical protein [Deinococcus misasensis]
METELFRFRLITDNQDAQDWEPFRLRKHLQDLTGMLPEVQRKEYNDINPATHSGFEVRIRSDVPHALDFLRTLKGHFRIEQI